MDTRELSSEIRIWLVTTDHLERDDQKTEVLRQLRRRFSSNVNQLARVVGLSYDDTARLLDSQ